MQGNDPLESGFRVGEGGRGFKVKCTFLWLLVGVESLFREGRFYKNSDSLTIAWWSPSPPLPTLRCATSLYIFSWIWFTCPWVLLRTLWKSLDRKTRNSPPVGYFSFYCHWVLLVVLIMWGVHMKSTTYANGISRGWKAVRKIRRACNIKSMVNGNVYIVIKWVPVLEVPSLN